MLGRGKADDIVRKSFANLIEKGCFHGTVSVGETHPVCFTMSNWPLWVLCRQDVFLTPWSWLWVALSSRVTTTALAMHSLKQQRGCQPPSCPASGFGTVLQRRHVGRDGVVRAGVEGVGWDFVVVQYNKRVERDLPLLLASHPCAVFEHVPRGNQPRC